MRGLRSALTFNHLLTHGAVQCTHTCIIVCGFACYIYVLIFAGDKCSLYSRPSYPSRKFALAKNLNCALIRIIVPRLRE